LNSRESMATTARRVITDAGRLTFKQVALKTLQVTSLFDADVAIGSKAYPMSLDRESFPDLFSSVEELHREIEREQVAEAMNAHETFVDRTKRLARECKKRLDIGRLLHKRKKLLAKIGRSIRESDSAPADTIRYEVTKARAIDAKARALGLEIAELSARQARWIRAKITVVTVAVVSLGLLAFKSDAPTPTTTLPVSESMKDDLPALLLAAQQGDNSRIRDILRDGANVDQKGPGGETALHWAAAYGKQVAAELLLASGANPNEKDRAGMTPLHYAAQEGQIAIIDALLKASADPNAGDENGITPMHLAAANGFPSIIQQLLSHGGDVDAADAIGTTPLHMAAAEGKSNAIEVLVAAGADLMIMDKDDHIAYDLAVVNCHNDAAALLKAAAPDTAER
jgi:ankyrin repeat protein